MKLPMKYHSINDLKIPKLGLGTWQLEGFTCTEIIAKGLAAGYRLIDTAQIYQNEDYVGDGIRESGVNREDIYLVSKVWRDNLSREEVVNSTQESLNKLNTDYMDLMLIHWPNEEVALDETLAGMEELLNEGMVRDFGVSNFPISLLEQTQDLAPDFICNQVEYHPFLNQDEILNWLKENNKFLMAYSPLARGAVFQNETIKKIAHKHAATEAQICLAWLMNKENVIAIPKTSSEERLLGNLDSLLIQLDKEDLTQIENLKAQNTRLIQPEFSPLWDTP